MMKTVLVFLADGFEMIEALTPVDYLRRAKQDVRTVAVPSATMKNEKIVTSSHNVTVTCDLSFSDFLADFNEELPDAVVCPGGSVGAVNLSKCSELLNFIERCHASKKYVCAICASPAVVLGKTSVLNRETWCCYPGMQTQAKAEYLENYKADKRVVVSENVITACGEGASEEFALTIVEKLAGKEEALRILNGCCCRQ